MTLNELALKLRMMDWIPIGAGYMRAPENYEHGGEILLAGENEILINILIPEYYTNKEAFDIIMENTND